jgi:hypothetical protein
LGLQQQKPVYLTKILNSLTVTYGEHIDTYVPHYFALQLQQMNKQTASLTKKIVILQCILNNWEEIFNGDYADSIVEQYHNTFNRLLATCETGEGWHEDDSEIYWKDLAMSQRLLFPAGSQIVSSNCGFDFTQGLNPNFKTLQYLWLNLRQGGCKGYYRIHTHTPNLTSFNPQGWESCYLRIAQMLKLNPQIKGVFGTSWFFDPKLMNISPRLMYLQNIPLQHGAHCFHVGEDKSGNAIHTSQTRRDLYYQGKYTPQTYLLIWPRAAIIKWAKNVQKRSTINTQSLQLPTKLTSS